MPEDKLSELKTELSGYAKKFSDELKSHNYNVKAWNIGVGKDGDATTLKISLEVNITPRKK